MHTIEFVRHRYLFGVVFLVVAVNTLTSIGDDNVVLSAEDHKKINRIEREWRYLAARATAAEKIIGHNPELQAIRSSADKIRSLCEARDKKLLSGKKVLSERLVRSSAKIIELLHPEDTLVVTFADPYERLDPASVQRVDTVRGQEIVTLPGEYQALGLIVSNGATDTAQCRISVSGLNPEYYACVVRKQVFLETYYTKEKERVADPLPLLQMEGSEWKLTVPGGDSVKLYISMHVSEKAEGRESGIITIQHCAGSINLPFAIEVINAPLPSPRCFEYTAFLRFNEDRRHLWEAAAKDLEEHGTSMMTLHYYLPKALFTREGEIASLDFSVHDEYLKIFAPHVERLMVNWNSYPISKFDCTDGSVITEEDSEWEKAFTSLLKAWFGHVTNLGYKPEQFIHYVVDEPAGVRKRERAIKIWKLAKQAVPELPVLVTLCDYAGPEDTQVMIPYVDIAFVGIPYRERLPDRKIKAWGKRLGENYNPRQSYQDIIFPMLRHWQKEKKGRELLSWHINRGVSDDELVWNRAYPVVAAAKGLSGAGHWAYWDVNGDSWDDTDGRRERPDHIMVYDGSEEIPVNFNLNPTNEKLLPSIRWEALRAGLQDARILMTLKRSYEEGRCPPFLKAHVSNVLDDYTNLATDPTAITHESVNELASRTRELYRQYFDMNVQE